MTELETKMKLITMTEFESLVRKDKVLGVIQGHINDLTGDATYEEKIVREYLRELKTQIQELKND